MRALALLLCSVLCVSGDFVTKKQCKDVNQSECETYNVILDPCPGGPSFCSLKRDKRYSLTVDFMPKFSTEKLKIAMYGDDSNTERFEKSIKTPEDACHMLTCPVEAYTRRIFDIDFQLDKTLAVAKFPVKVKLWNEDNESQACCFTFMVKIKK